jgi:hypothetical protein
MSFLTYLSPGNDIYFRFNIDGEEFTYAGSVYQVDSKTLSIEVNDKGLSQKEICKGMSALLVEQQHGEKISIPVRIESSDSFPIIHVREQNSRSHFRIDGFISLTYTKVLGEEYVRIREQYLNKISPENEMERSDSNLNNDLETNTDTNAIPVEIFDTINLLNKKLNYLQDLMDNPKDVALFEQEPVKVNISGSGMRFNSRDSFRVGDLLDMKMVLPSSPSSIIKTVALVVRVDHSPKNESSPEEGYNLVAVKFIVINEDDRDSIIRYTFTWKRQMLRQKQMVHEEEMRFSG